MEKKKNRRPKANPYANSSPPQQEMGGNQPFYPVTNSNPFPNQNPPQDTSNQSQSNPFPSNPPTTNGTSNAPNPFQNPIQNLTSQFSNLSTNNALGIESNRSSPFPTNSQAQADDAFFALTIHCIPQSQQILSKTQIPLGAIIHPLAPGKEVEQVNMGQIGIIRCKFCRAYINPFVDFIEGGRRWKCCFCYGANDVPSSYYRELDSNGIRVDIDERPELKYGSVEFLAPSEYLQGAPQAPTYLFCIDVSYSSVSSGMLATAVAAIKASLDLLPGESRTRIGFITFDNSVHVYNLKSTLTKPQVLVIPDVEELFLPVPSDDILVNLTESRHLVEELLDKLPQIWSKTQNVDCAAGPAIKVAYAVGKNCGGKIMLLQSSFPNVGQKTVLEQREQKKATDIGTDNEILFYKVQNEEYQKIALNCSNFNLSVDVFVFTSNYVDAATLGILPQTTGGELFHYAFHGAVDAQDKIALYNDLCKVMYMRETGFQSVMRLRCSKGIEVNTKFIFGNFVIKNGDLLHMPVIDADKSFAFQLKITENLTYSKYACFQSVLLYTTSEGLRKMRVMTKSVPVTSSVLDVFRSSNARTVASLLAKLAVDKALTSQIKFTREAIMNKCVDTLKVYKTTPGVPLQNNSILHFPENLQVLPLYLLGMLKHYSFAIMKGIRPDIRTYFFHRIRVAPVDTLMALFHPELYPLEFTSISNPENPIPSPVRLTAAELTKGSLFLLDNHISLYLWISKNILVETMFAVFGVQDYLSIPSDNLPVLDNEYSNAVRNLVNLLRQKNRSFQRLYIVREGDNLTIPFLNFLIEDKTNSAPPLSFHQFLLHIQGTANN